MTVIDLVAGAFIALGAIFAAVILALRALDL